MSSFVGRHRELTTPARMLGRVERGGRADRPESQARAIDLVGADREPVAKRITMVGSVKWLERRPFDAHDLAQLGAHRSRVPGADATTPSLVVSRSGAPVEGVPVIDPDELVAAYR